MMWAIPWQLAADHLVWMPGLPSTVGNVLNAERVRILEAWRTVHGHVLPLPGPNLRHVGAQDLLDVVLLRIVIEGQTRPLEPVSR